MLNSQTLLRAARGGKWSPDLSLISFHLTPWIFEMALAVPLPGLCYHLFWILINLFGGCFLLSGNLCCRGVCSPEQCDLMVGRKTMSDLHIAEIVLVSINVVWTFLWGMLPIHIIVLYRDIFIF